MSLLSPRVLFADMMDELRNGEMSPTPRLFTVWSSFQSLLNNFAQVTSRGCLHVSKQLGLGRATGSTPLRAVGQRYWTERLPLKLHSQ